MLEAIERGTTAWAHGRGLGGAHARLGGGAARGSSSRPGNEERALAAAGRRAGALRLRCPTASTRRRSGRSTSTAAPSGGACSPTSRAAGVPGEPAGSVRYGERELDALGRGPVILYVGRFTEVKRLPLLLEAFADARATDAAARLADPGRRPPGRVGGRASGRRDRAARPRRRDARGLVRPGRAAGAAGRRRPARAGLGARELRPGDRRGDGLRRPGDRRRLARPGADHRRRGDRLAVRCERPRWRCAEALLDAVDGPDERARRAQLAGRPRSTASPGRRSPAGSSRCCAMPPAAAPNRRPPTDLPARS